MVLQQKANIKIWGWADAGDELTVSIGDNLATVTVDESGKWQVQLAPMKASNTPLSLVVKGGHSEIEFKDILIGEVWLCSGQSNMEWTVASFHQRERGNRCRQLSTDSTHQDPPQAIVVAIG